jgi:parvulin-like peptidyl-prolyl isomerase
MKLTAPRLSALVLAAAASAGVGCSRQPKAQPLSPDAFMTPRSGTTNTGGAGGGMATGQIPTDGGAPRGPGEAARPAVQIPARVTPTPDGQTPRPTPVDTTPGPRGAANPPANSQNAAAAGPTAGGLAPSASGSTLTGTDPAAPRTGVSDVIDRAIRPVGPNPTATNPSAPLPTGSAAAPTGLPPIGASTGQFMTLGGVVAEVNGTPIYANKVLQLLDKPLRGKAKLLDAARFRKQAADDVRKQIVDLVRYELEVAAAQRYLDADDRRLADAATIYWRQQQITRAGGSLELARRASQTDPENPMDFDERTAEQNRAELIKLYYQKKVHPKIQVSAVDVRDYYDRNVDKEFTENEKAEFRIIKVDIKRTGSKEKAIDKAANLHKRAKAGEDFAAMAKKENDERMFAGDKPFDVSPKSFAIVKVRDALAKLQPGEVSEVIEDRDGFYLVKLEKRQAGVVHAFDEQKVQDTIRFKLKSDQFRAMREQVQQNLMKGAVMKPDMGVLLGLQPPSPADAAMLNVAVDMAMQRYPQYVAAK